MAHQTRFKVLGSAALVCAGATLLGASAALSSQEPTLIGKQDSLPGLLVEILSVDGGTGVDGTFRIGDTLRVTYDLSADDGTPIPLEDVDYGGIMVSGPVGNYQRVIALQTDLRDSQRDEHGDYVYTFRVPIPDAFLPPLNDSPAFGAEHGELTGQPLIPGTYTVGIEAYCTYKVKGMMGGMKPTAASRERGDARERSEAAATEASAERERPSEREDPPERGGGMKCGCMGGGMGMGMGGMQCGCMGMGGMGGGMDADMGGGMGGGKMMCCCEKDREGGMSCKCCAGMMKLMMKTFIDAGSDAAHFALETTQALASHEVVTEANCNQCHVELRSHAGTRRDTDLCVLCHTAGAEDFPDALAAVEPATIDFGVMVHKIHNGAHLPSVLGVGTNPDGTRNYGATPIPYQLVADRGDVRDFSSTDFPVWPNRSHPLPRDAGYSALSATEQALEDSIRSGVGTCAKCHGDPDDEGPLEAPADGLLAYTRPSTSACGSCHDDIDWALPYAANLQKVDDHTGTDCIQCHAGTGSPLAVVDGHLHPLKSLDLNPGVQFDLHEVRESGAHDGDGTIDPGEKVLVSFDIVDDSGQPVDPSELDRFEVAMSGPTTNRNILVDTKFPIAALAGSQVSVHVPEAIQLEVVGVATNALGDTFATARSPHWDVAGAESTLWVQTGLAGPVTRLAADAARYENFVDVQDASGFMRGDIVLIDAGSVPGAATRAGGRLPVDYFQVQYVDGHRLWLSSIHDPYTQPWLRESHLAGAPVRVVTLTQMTEGVDYQLDPATGTVTELTEFGAENPVIVSYTADFVLPEWHRGSMNDSPDLAESAGEWTGLRLVDGTYSLGLWGERTVTAAVAGETTTYPSPSQPATREFLVGSAGRLESARIIASGESCNACHDEVMFHGGHRLGFDTCIQCHGAAGSEDRPQYVAANAPATQEVSTAFRRLLHKIHMGRELSNASTYAVVGFGVGYPNNYSVHSYEEVGFPASPGGTRQCVKCHGTSDAWMTPGDRNHPDGQEDLTQAWNTACSACHDSSSTRKHIEMMTDPRGVESCTMCHAQGKMHGVDLVHMVR